MDARGPRPHAGGHRERRAVLGRADLSLGRTAALLAALGLLVLGSIPVRVASHFRALAGSRVRNMVNGTVTEVSPRGDGFVAVVEYDYGTQRFETAVEDTGLLRPRPRVHAGQAVLVDIDEDGKPHLSNVGLLWRVVVARAIAGGALLLVALVGFLKTRKAPGHASPGPSVTTG